MNNNPTYQQTLCSSCATSVESNTETTRQRDVNGTITTANDTVRLVPELRFPEFQNAGAWEGKKIGDISFSFSGGTPPVANREYYGGEIPFIRSGEIGSGSTKLYLSQNGIKSSAAKIVDKGTLLYALYGATSGEVAISKIRGAINQAVLAIIPNDYMSVSFIYQYLSANKSRIVNQYIQGGQGNLSGTIINSLVIPIPSLLEQQKIADCMQSVDEYVAATNQKLEQLKIHKKALLQKLFPQRGKNIPEFRFPEFQKAEPWEENTLGGEFGICELRNGYTPSKENDKFWTNGTIPWFRMEDIRKHGRILKDSIQHITPEAVKGELFDAGSIIISTSATIGEYALLIVDSLANQRFTNIMIRKSRKKDIDSYFLFYYCHYISEWCKRNTNTGGLLSVDMDGLKRYKLYIPKDKNEQKKIAKALGAIDEFIKATEQKIEILKLHKQGLLQQLFPKKQYQ